SCSTPNLQQVPRDGASRQAVRASPGYLLLAADYTLVELRALAAHCLHRYGWSTMAVVIKAGTDPHAHTAAMMLSVPAEEFATWKNNETVADTKHVDGKVVEVKLKDRYDRARQMAKPVNFGVPGGLGVASLVAYAHSTYKVDFTFDEAKERRDLLIKKIYPELEHYLSEDTIAIVARNLQAPLWEVRNELGDTHISCIRKVLAGDPKRADGTPYQGSYVSRIWASLAGLNKNPALKEALEKRQASAELAARVCHAGVATLTGRIRGRVRYSQARNTPFQGLAADGAALALFELVKDGFRVVGFVHDEVLVELPDEGGYVSEAKVRRVEEILCRQMEKVLGDVPAAVESALSTRWSKKAKLVTRDGKVYPWTPEGGWMVPSPAGGMEPARCLTDDTIDTSLGSDIVQATEADSDAPARELVRLPIADPPREQPSPQRGTESHPAVNREGIRAVGVTDVLAGRQRWCCEQGDAVAWLRSLPEQSLDLVFGSPPYTMARRYLEAGADLHIARDAEGWAAWMVDVFHAALRACRGLVAFVVEGQTKDFRWDAAPALLMADLHRAGIHLRKPPVFHRVGIPGSGGPDWLRNDFEFIVCATNGGKLPWSDNTAMGHPPKWAPGGEMSHRRADGERVNTARARKPVTAAKGLRASPDGLASGEKLPTKPTRNENSEQGYRPPEIANPGNVIHVPVGGGLMGDRLCHENEAPFPEYLAEFFIRSFCPPDGIVADCFSGSGTTAKVAVQRGRRFVGCDLRPSQVDLTHRRLAGVSVE
ncbi:MAG TPA: DNA methyltransferase, partial [Gemmataceae bacterium]|nr:DNA methyltransferase [Gemmataceae bacterium]